MWLIAWTNIPLGTLIIVWQKEGGKRIIVVREKLLLRGKAGERGRRSILRLLLAVFKYDEGLLYESLSQYAHARKGKGGPMRDVIIKATISLAIIFLATGLARRFPSLAGLIGVMPLTGALVLVWTYLENRGSKGNAELCCRCHLRYCTEHPLFCCSPRRI